MALQLTTWHSSLHSTLTNFDQVNSCCSSARPFDVGRSQPEIAPIQFKSQRRNFAFADPNFNGLNQGFCQVNSHVPSILSECLGVSRGQKPRIFAAKARKPRRWWTSRTTTTPAVPLPSAAPVAEPRPRGSTRGFDRRRRWPPWPMGMRWRSLSRPEFAESFGFFFFGGVIHQKCWDFTDC